MLAFLHVFDDLAVVLQISIQYIRLTALCEIHHQFEGWTPQVLNPKWKSSYDREK